MGAQPAKIEAAAPFNAFAAYEREREWSRELETRLAKSLMLLGLAADRLERRNVDVSHIRGFIKGAAQ